ncbi:helix-turn-helix domain-containing protein [Allobranchiibius sp. CTAmp26]|uniref:winged helix-turn-helix transcriptional regulator n=1 Tax=Allobranchiibius sp. CTAmp26 TaxID=2815214 RepID=UPI001AA1B5A2|nr:helix-turn-helix domain-containing protein [Allobranchiibius sp. CTAmp26]MBO1756687.1 helix-turn-helix transcriptional regulator [Allobranchiibius sp. CTAmp26]
MPIDTADPVATPCAEGKAFDPCPVSPVVDVAFSRWTTPILWLLQNRGPLRFNVMRDALGTVTAKTLTGRLRQLERDGLITRTQFPEVPPRVEYEITELGASLTPAFKMLVAWSEDHMSRVRDARDRYDDAGRPMPA